jgi:hypothetical protein
LKKIILVSVLLSVLTGLLSWIPISYNLSYSSFYVSKEYNGDMVNLNEIVEKVENFDYKTHLNISKDPYGVRILNYTDPTIIDELSIKIEEDRQRHYLQVPFINSHLIYTFNVNRSSFFNITLEEWDEFEGYFPNCDGLQMKSESFNICPSYEISPPNFFLNSSFYPDPIDNGVEYCIEEVITVEISFYYSRPEFLNSNSCEFNQIVILNENLEIIFICVYDFSRQTT